MLPSYVTMQPSERPLAMVLWVPIRQQFVVLPPLVGQHQHQLQGFTCLSEGSVCACSLSAKLHEYSRHNLFARQIGVAGYFRQHFFVRHFCVMLCIRACKEQLANHHTMPMINAADMLPFNQSPQAAPIILTCKCDARIGLAQQNLAQQEHRQPAMGSNNKARNNND